MTTDCTFKYKILFEPVPPRRLGISLGVDLMYHKTCSLDCGNCECGATTHITTKRGESFSVDRVKEKLDTDLSRHEKINYITFSGSGEPTLNAGTGDVVHFLKSDYPQYKIALLTNSTRFDRPEVMRQIKDADGVIFNTLDRSGSESWVQPAGQNRLKDISDFLEGAEMVRYKTVKPETAKRQGSTVRRRPCTAHDVARSMGGGGEAAQPVLDELVTSNQLATKQMDRGCFCMVSSN